MKIECSAYWIYYIINNNIRKEFSGRSDKKEWIFTEFSAKLNNRVLNTKEVCNYFSYGEVIPEYGPVPGQLW